MGDTVEAELGSDIGQNPRATAIASFKMEATWSQLHKVIVVVRSP